MTALLFEFIAVLFLIVPALYVAICVGELLVALVDSGEDDE